MADVIVPIEMLLATTAKVLCSAVFVSGRDPQEAFDHSAPWALHANQLPEVLSQHVRWEVDRAGRKVQVHLEFSPDVAQALVAAHRAAYPGFDADWDAEVRRLAGMGPLTRTAQHVGDQGCLIVPLDGDGTLHFTPTALRRGPAPSIGWPQATGTTAPAPVPAPLRARVAQVLEGAFANADAHHAAVLVVQSGQIVGERYAPGFTADMPLESWSMGKSVIGTLIGLLVGRGALELDAPAPVAAWQAPGDPRGAITLRHLLNMCSGLRCTGQDDPRSAWRDGLPEHFLPYGQALDLDTFATARPAEFPPGTVGRYRNCDPLSLAVIFEQTVRERLGADPLAWPQTELFDRLGMHGLTLETDRWGRFIISGFNYGTARDWARLGQLYLQDGVWQGQRVLPAGWVDFARAPAPGWEKQNYGAQMWRNSVQDFALPADTFYMAGGGGQYVFMVPSADLVVVRMGHARGWAASKANVNALLRALVPAVTEEPLA